MYRKTVASLNKPFPDKRAVAGVYSTFHHICWVLHVCWTPDVLGTVMSSTEMYYIYLKITYYYHGEFLRWYIIVHNNISPTPSTDRKAMVDKDVMMAGVLLMSKPLQAFMKWRVHN